MRIDAGRAPIWGFLAYFVLWSYFVGSALVSACGVAVQALIPVFADSAQGKVVFGVASSLIGLVLVRLGGYAWFARVMSVCIGVMFLVVVATAISLWPGTGAIVDGFVPSAEALRGDGLGWTVALLGGVGGTVTILCYGYWMQEEDREGLEQLTLSRIDLGIGYAVTALFGLGMVIIGSTVTVSGSGADLVVAVASALEGPLGPIGRWAFLVGAFGAVFSSLLGVWQAVPYLFADMVGLLQTDARGGVDTSGAAYRRFSIALAIVPLYGLFGSFREVQKIYAVVGASFMPLLAVALLIQNGRPILGRARNGILATTALLTTVAFFAWVAGREWFAP